MTEMHETTCDRCGAAVQTTYRAQLTHCGGCTGTGEPVGICNSDFPMPRPYCREPVEGIFRHTRADGEVIEERAVCRSCGEREVLMNSNDPFGSGETATFEPFPRHRGPGGE